MADKPDPPLDQDHTHLEPGAGARNTGITSDQKSRRAELEAKIAEARASLDALEAELRQLEDSH